MADFLMPCGFANAVLLTGSADLLTFMAALDQLGLPIESWAVGIIGTKANVPRSMIGDCMCIAGHDGVVFVDLATAEGPRAFGERFGLSFEAVAISHLFGRAEEALLARLAWNHLILTENGIATWWPPHGRIGPRAASGYDQALPAFLPQTAILPLSGHPELRTPFYLRSVSDLRIIGHDAGAYAATLARARRRLGLAPPEKRYASEGRIVFVAGTSLARAGIISAEAEARAYHDLVARTLADDGGQTCVIWKPHPRALQPVQLPQCDPTRLAVIDTSAPLELWLPIGQAGVEVHSAASSVLLTAQMLHGLSCRGLPVAMRTHAHPHVAFMQSLFP